MTAASTQDTQSGPSEQSEQVAVAALSQRVVAAWAYQDGDAFADVFTEDGTMILAGVYLKGRDKIAEYMKSAFEGKYKGTQVTGKPIDIRFLTPEVCVLLTMGGVLEQGESEITTDSAIRACWLAQKVNGEWRLAAYQNTPRD